VVTISTGQKRRSAARSAATIAVRRYGWLPFAKVLAIMLAALFLVYVLVLVSGTAGQAQGCSSGVNPTGKDNTEIAFNYLQEEPELHLTSAGASIAVGNFIHESGGDPIETHNPDPTSGADGIAHWLGGRLTALKNHQFQGRSWNDIYLQLDYLREELTGPYRSVLQMLQKAKSFSDIAPGVIAFEQGFERSGNTASYPIRTANAEDVYRRYSKNDPGALATGLGDTSCGLSAIGAGGYVSPFAGSVNPSRVDQGVDYSMAVGSPIRLIGDAQIIGIIPGWYHGQPFVWYKLMNGQLAGKYIFVAEQINILVHPDPTKVIPGGTTIATYAPSGTAIEMGFADASGHTLARSTGGYSEGQSTAAGASFNRLMASLDVPLGRINPPVVGSVGGLGLP
jgi:hypothetical protein